MELHTAGLAAFMLWGTLLVLDALRSAAEGTTAMVVAFLAVLPPTAMGLALLGRWLYKEHLRPVTVQNGST